MLKFVKTAIYDIDFISDSIYKKLKIIKYRNKIFNLLSYKVWSGSKYIIYYKLRKITLKIVGNLYVLVALIYFSSTESRLCKLQLVILIIFKMRYTFIKKCSFTSAINNENKLFF